MDDYIVDAKTNQFLWEQAELTLKSLGVDVSHRIDVCSFFRHAEIVTVFGVRRLTLEVTPESEMGESDGFTSYGKSTASVQIRESIWKQAKAGDRRPRMTVAHELGHAVLHCGPTLHRRMVEPQRPAYIEASRSAEHQAKVFAARLLMPTGLIEGCVSAAEIAERCQVSFLAAELRLQELGFSQRRKRTALKMYALAREIEKKSKVSANPEYLPDPCPSCGYFTVQAIGCRFMCMQCDNVSDKFQDGD